MFEKMEKSKELLEGGTVVRLIAPKILTSDYSVYLLVLSTGGVLILEDFGYSGGYASVYSGDQFLNKIQDPNGTWRALFELVEADLVYIRGLVEANRGEEV